MTAREERGGVAAGGETAVGGGGSVVGGDAVAGALRDAVARYVAANPASAARAERAAAHLPGANTRSVLHFDPFPLAFARAEGAHLYSLDGRRYTDFLGEFTAGLYGHSHPVILDAVRGALDRGLNYGGSSELEGELAELLCARFPALELVRFTNSGTEANLMALALALHHTGRREVLVFKGGYHGGVLAFGGGEPSPVTVPHAWVLGDYDDVEGTRALIRAHRFGAILVEPMLGSGGCRPASRAFLQMLREEATKAGAMLIFDEVMTSRLGPRDTPGYDGVVPDLMTVGKYLAGGMSFGAFGGRRDLMAAYDPTRPGALFHAGTFNNNVLSMSAGIAGLTQVLTDDTLRDLNARGDRLRAALDRVVTTTGRGSLMTMHPATDDLKQLLFFELLDAGYWIAARGMIALSLAITDEDCEAFAATVEKILA
ncbi:aminotransferase class III-fold pyridoxal phosphate-dependent enzyme [Solirubrobacter phytolaccae]|uniref:Aminotransferase class III-fold pyridoxal phosphate-dependent enzyme n=1 Tax=Solirubrobacter phytolaccae TaxID=1404360 RepID=A0A9X3NEK4_9ACTN|nr:aminotransferase class III-fold pyridoxal phosphate-dependent enzyme [Solirubrobacter phytolaccae]MDA0182591.1 aminotransferase class III-fold pyridoxal phosphate-dependent enzyme [Solirubrobacter phytolaccae]